MGGGGGQFELRYGLFKIVFSKERVKPYFLLLLINIIIRNIVSKNSIESPQVVQKI